MAPLNVAVIGCGRAAQTAHLPYLWRRRDLFRIAAIMDEDLDLASRVSSRYDVPATYREVGSASLRGIDALICATTPQSHGEIVVAALSAGCHVLCEKPLALTTETVHRIIDARDQANRVVQVGYMKRFDPGYQRALELLPPRADQILFIDCQVRDPNSLQQTKHLALDKGRGGLHWTETPEAIRQIEEVVGVGAPEEAIRAYSRGFASSLIHDLNLVNGILDRVGHSVPPTVETGYTYAGGNGVGMGLRLDHGGYAHLSYLRLPNVNQYEERISITTESSVLELRFSQPYLHHVPALLSVSTSEGSAGHIRSYVSTGAEENFERQLVHFHAACNGSVSVMSPPEQALADLVGVQRAFRLSQPRC